MNSEIIKKMQLEMSENGQNSEETAIENEKQPFVNDSENDLENEEIIIDNDGSNDPLNDFIQPDEIEEPIQTPVEEEIKKVTGDSAKNLKNLSDLGAIAFDAVDMWRAQLCGAIANQDPAYYSSDQKAKTAVIEAIKEYFASKEVSTPSPFWTMIIAIGIWGLPPLGIAFWHSRNRWQQQKQSDNSDVVVEYIPKMEVVKRPTQETVNIIVEEPVQEEPKQENIYKNTKEYKDGRKAFSIHKTKGCYNRLPDGTFCQIDLAKDYPSPEIQKLIDEGLSNQEIRDIIYAEQ